MTFTNYFRRHAILSLNLPDEWISSDYPGRRLCWCQIWHLWGLPACGKVSFEKSAFWFLFMKINTLQGIHWVLGDFFPFQRKNEGKRKTGSWDVARPNGRYKRMTKTASKASSMYYCINLSLRFRVHYVKYKRGNTLITITIEVTVTL